jgi:hypothetical protein
VYLFKRFVNGTLEGLCRLLAKSTFTVELGAMFIVVGTVFNRGLPVLKQGTPAAKTTTTTLTVAEVMGGMITANQGAAGAATYTTPTGAQLDAAMPSGFALNDSFDLILVNISAVAAETATIAGGSGVTLVGNGTVSSNNAATLQSQGTFRFRKTAAATWTIYRVS